MRGKRKRRLKRAAVAIVILLFLGVLSGALINWWIVRSTRDRLYTVDTLPGGATVGIVLGAMVYPSGHMPAVTSDRVDTAIELYQAGKIKKLLMSGDNSVTTYDEVTAMRNRAISKGVPPDDVVRDYAGFRTYDSVYRARDVWQQKDVVIITQEFHLPRAIWIADQLGVDAKGVIADKNRYLYIRRMESREILARLGAWVDTWILRRKPYFLGPVEELSGLKQDEEESRRRR